MVSNPSSSMEITASTWVSDSIVSQLAFPLPWALSRRLLGLTHLDDLWERGLIGGRYSKGCSPRFAWNGPARMATCA